MAVRITAGNSRELAGLVQRMIEVEHPSLDLCNMCLEHGVLRVPAIVPDLETAFLWEEEGDREGYTHCIEVYRCMRSTLCVHGVEEFTVTPGEECAHGLLDIRYQDGQIFIYEDYSQPFLRVRTGSLNVGLEITDQVVDVLTLHQWPDGAQMLVWGLDLMCIIFDEVGIEPPADIRLGK